MKLPFLGGPTERNITPIKPPFWGVSNPKMDDLMRISPPHGASRFASSCTLRWRARRFGAGRGLGTSTESMV